MRDPRREREQAERLREQLHALPPALAEPFDRFEQVGERVRRRRRRHTAVAVGGVVAAVALAVPVAAQLLPETAEVGPDVGVLDTHTAPVTHESDLRPGGTRVTHLSEPLTVTGTGTATVELGEKPAGTTGVAMVLDCLSAGDFTYPDGAGMICDADDAGRRTVAEEDYAAASYVIDLAQDADQIDIRATEGATWRLTTTYVSTELTAWGVNAKGETFGVHNEHGEPDLIAVSATNGRFGYAYVADMNAADGPEPTSPEHAVELQEQLAGRGVSVPVYESDGETVVGEFVIGGGDDPAQLGDEVTVTRSP